MSWRAGSLAFSMFATSGCATTIDPDWFSRAAPSHHDVADWFPAAPDILDGVDAPGDSDRLEVGDRALYGVAIVEPGERETWLVLLEVVDSEVSLGTGDGKLPLRANFEMTYTTSGTVTRIPLSSRILEMRVTLFDANGVRLGENLVQVPRSFLAHGFHQACRVSHGLTTSKPGPEFDADDPAHRELAESATTTAAASVAFVNLVAKSDQLAPILWKAIPMPNPLGVLFAGGVDLSVNTDLDQTQRQPPPYPSAWGPEPYRFSMVLSINGDEMLLCSVVAAPSDSPRNVGAGVVSLRGRRPGDGETGLLLQLLACRRAVG